VRLDELVGLRLAHAGDLERHVDRSEPVRFGRAARALDRDLDAREWHAGLLGVHFDQGDAARRHAGQEGLTVGQSVVLRPRRGIEGDPVTPGLAEGPPKDATVRRSHTIDLDIGHLHASSQALRTYPAIYHTLGPSRSGALFPGGRRPGHPLRWK